MTYEQYNEAIDRLIESIKNYKDWDIRFDSVMPVPRGGYYPAIRVAQALGLRIVNEQQAIIQHLEGTSISVNARRENFIMQSRKKYFLKTMPEWHYKVANILTKSLLFIGETAYKLCGKKELAEKYSCRRQLISKYE